MQHKGPVTMYLMTQATGARGSDKLDVRESKQV